ncbi:hypothetical protein D3C75_993740 [compost metagenome]
MIKDNRTECKCPKSQEVNISRSSKLNLPCSNIWYMRRSSSVNLFSEDPVIPLQSDVPIFTLYSSKISLGAVTIFAPCLSKSRHPLLLGEVIGPGTANTSRLYSSARSAVINEPLLTSASITIVPLDNPAIILFRCGNIPG